MNIKDLQSNIMIGRDHAFTEFERWLSEFGAPIGKRMERLLMMNMPDEQSMDLEDIAPEAFRSVAERARRGG